MPGGLQGGEWLCWGQLPRAALHGLLLGWSQLPGMLLWWEGLGEALPWEMLLLVQLGQMMHWGGKFVDAESCWLQAWACPGPHRRCLLCFAGFDGACHWLMCCCASHAWVLP